MLLSVENLHVAYGAVHALQGVSLAVEPGEISIDSREPVGMTQVGLRLRI